MKSLKKTLVLLVVFSMILSTLVPAFAFSDVEDGSVYEDQITRMAALGIINGYAEDGTFRPEETVTRAQMVKIICMMLGLDEGDAKGSEAMESKFSDVAAGHWANGWINVAANKGIVNGYPDGTFRPDAPLTLNEVLTLCVKALGRGGYVDQMGAWPGNYLTEAARLQLKADVENVTDANRGTVAVIAWNTLNAPTWYVSSEDLNSNVSLGHNNNSLLEINYPDFVDNGVLKELQGVEVSYVPSKLADLGERQIALTVDLDTDGDYDWLWLDEYYMSAKPFATKVPAKNEDTATFRFVKENAAGAADDEELLFVYVPEDVCEDVNSLYGRKVTIIFGDDNEAVAIKNIDKVVENQYLTAYEDKEVTIGGETYKFATDAEVYVNTVKMTGKAYTYDATDYVAKTTYTSVPTTGLTAATATADAVMAPIAEALEIEDLEDIEKVIKANIVLNSKGTKIARLDLFVSGEYAEFDTHEAVVEKVSREVIHLSNGGKISYKDVEEEDLPNVMKDGKNIDITDIEAGDVLTYYGADEDTADTIYVSSETAEGKVASIRKANKAIKINEGTFAPSTTNAQMTTRALKDGEWSVVDTTKVVKNDEVVIYLNIYGEYCAISLEKEISDWEFGVVTLVYDDINYEGEDDEIVVRDIKLLAADGTKAVRYTVKADTSSDDIADDAISANITTAKLVNELVMFTADADRNIDFEDLYVINDTTIGTKAATKEASTGLSKEFFDEYTFVKTTADAYIAGKRIDLDGATEVANVDYRYSASTALLNLGDKNLACNVANGVAHKVGCDVGTGLNTTGAACTGHYDVDVEKIGEWDSIISSNDFVSLAYIVAEDGKDVPVCIALFVDEYATSDAVYAMVEVDAYETEEDNYVTLLTENGSEEIDLHKNFADADLDEMYKNAFVEYYTSSGKITTATALVDVKAFNKLATKDDSTVTAAMLVSGDDTTLVNSLGVASTSHVRYENFEVSEIIVDEDDYEVVYKEISNPVLAADAHNATATNQVETLSPVLVEKGEVTVYDLRNGFEVISMADFVAEVNDETREEEIMVVAFSNTVNMAGSTYDADILVIL